MRGRIFALLAVTGALGVGLFFVFPQPSLDLTPRIMDRRCRGGCMSSVQTPAFQLLPRGFASYATNNLTGSKGQLLINNGTSGKFCSNGSGLTFLPVLTNLLTQSNFGSTDWAVTSIAGSMSLAANTSDLAAPDGTFTAAKLVLPAVAGTNYAIERETKTVPSGNVTLSVYARNPGTGSIFMYVSDGTYHRITIPPNSGWTRYSTTFNSAGGFDIIDIGVNGNDTGETPQPAQTVYIWGANVTTGSAPGYNIPTQASQVSAAPLCVEPQGLMIEQSSTNILLQSQALATTPWSAGSIGPGTIANNTADVTAPDGTSTASKFVSGDTTGAPVASILRQPVTTTATTHSYSCYLRTLSGNATTYLAIGDSISSPWQQCSVTPTWSRCVLPTGSLTAASHNFDLGVNKNNTGEVGQVASTIYAWGCQVEALPYATSYIPTTTTSATRSSDLITLANPIAPTAGAWCASTNDVAQSQLATAAYVFGVGANGLANSWNAYDQGKVAFGVNDGTNTQVGLTTPQTAAVGLHRFGVADTNGLISAYYDTSLNTAPTGAGSGVVVQNATMQLGGINGNFVQGAMWLSGVNVDSTATSCAVPNTSYTPLFTLLPTPIPSSTLAAGTLTGTKGETITTARASSKYCTGASGLVLLGNNVPCVEANGLLVEAAGTNLAPWSTDFTQGSAWGVHAVTLTANAGTAPDGTNTAALVSEDGTTAPHYFASGGITTTAGNAAMSLYIKAGTSTVAALSTGTPIVNVNLTTCSLISSASVTGPTFTALPNGWCRVTAGFTSGTSTFLQVSPNSGNPSVTGSGKTVYIWGFQLEQAPYATSYIPTSSTSATRAYDNVTAVNPIAGATPGAFCVSADVTPEGAPSGQIEVVDMGNAFTNVNLVEILLNGSLYYDPASNVDALNPVTPVITATTHHIYAANAQSSLTFILDGVGGGTPNGVSGGPGTLNATVQFGQKNSAGPTGTSGAAWLRNIVIDPTLTGCQ